MLREIESQRMLERIYPDSISVPLSSIKVPDDLGKLVNDLAGVARYVDHTQTPEGSVDDNVKDHLFRLQWRLITLPKEKIKHVPHELISRCGRQIWVHDTGELGNDKDVVVTAKVANDEVAKKAETDEREIARGLLSESDYVLYEDFETAGAYLRGKKEDIPTGHAILAKTMDFIDGPLVYFYFFTKWLENHEYDGKVPPSGVFTYTLSENGKFRKRLLQAEELDAGIKDVCLYMLSQQIEVVIALWDGANNVKVPVVMAEQLDLMRKSLG